MAGARSLSGQAALRSGAGLVTVATPANCADVVAGLEPSYMTLPLPEDANGRLQASECQDILNSFPADVIGCGPGFGRSSAAGTLVRWLYRTFPHPLVVDADGLNLLAAEQIELGEAAGPRILTPHPGEFQRLAPEIPGDVSTQRHAAREWAARHHVVLVLKGARTLVTNGVQSYENTTGNPGMATGGTGDVLTGVITGLLGQKLPPFEAAQLGTFVHGMAGDLAANAFGQISMIASDLLKFLPAAMQQVAD